MTRGWRTPQWLRFRHRSRKRACNVNEPSSPNVFPNPPYLGVPVPASMVAKLAGTLKLASVVMLLFSLLIAANPAEVIAPTRVAAATTPSVYAPLATAATTLEHFTASTANWNCTAAGLSATNSTSSLNAARSTIFEPLLTSACASSCLHVPLSESSHSSPCIIRDGQVVPLASAVDPPQSSDRDPASAFARSQRRVIHPPTTDAGTLQLLQRWYVSTMAVARAVSPIKSEVVVCLAPAVAVTAAGALAWFILIPTALVSMRHRVMRHMHARCTCAMLTAYQLSCRWFNSFCSRWGY
jgi:hypothetical protein